MKCRLIACALMGMTLIAAQAATSRPNVLFIAIDDLNDWIGCMGGNPDTLTPNLDRLAGRGVMFTNAMCPAPSCIPSRGAMMTGKSPINTGIYRNLSGGFRMYDDLKDAIIIPQYFRDQGYKTFGVGKLLHDFNTNDYEVAWDHKYWINPFPPGSETSDPTTPLDKELRSWAPLDVDNTEMKDWQAAQWTAGHLGQKHDQPFFMACGFFRPHQAWNVPRKYYEKFPLDSLTLPKVLADDLKDVGNPVREPNALATQIMADETVWRRAVQAYLANINFADDCLGVVLDALDRSEYRDNTVIVLWSDHGWHLGEKQRWTKFTLWEESARCVLMAAGPGIPAGESCHHPVNLLDIYPTLNELCNLPVKEGLDGTSFVPSLRNPKAKGLRGPSLTANEVGITVRDEQWRYIRYNDGSEELYDHAADPMEWTNLAARPEHAATLDRLKAVIPKKPAVERDKVLKKQAEARARKEAAKQQEAEKQP